MFIKVSKLKHRAAIQWIIIVLSQLYAHSECLLY